MKKCFKACTNQGLKQIPRVNGIDKWNVMNRRHQQEMVNNTLPTAVGRVTTTTRPEVGRERRHHWNLQRVAVSIP